MPNNPMRDALRSLIVSNGAKFFGVEFIKKDGTTRHITGHMRRVAGHDGINTVADKPEYITVVLAEKDARGNEQFRNVNLDTIQALHIAGKRIKIS